MADIEIHSDPRSSSNGPQSVPPLAPQTSYFDRLTMGSIIKAFLLSLPPLITLVVAELASVNVMDYDKTSTLYNHEYKNDSIPFYAVGLIGVFGNFALFALFTYVLLPSSSIKDSTFKLVVYMYGYMLCSLYVNAMVEITKTEMGRLRPNAFQRTILLDGGVLNASKSAVSFPSGHTAWSFASPFYWMFVMSDDDDFAAGTGTGLFKPLVVGFWLSVAWMVSMTRIRDNRHFEWDVLGGILVAFMWCFTVGRPIQAYLKAVEAKSQVRRCT